MLLIDDKRNVFIVKFDLSFTSVELILEIMDKNIFHCCWVELSTKIVFTTTQNKIFVLDFIDYKLVENKVDFDSSNTSIHYSSDQKVFLLIQKNNSKVIRCSLEFVLDEVYQSKNNSLISSFIVCSDKGLLILGYKNGDMETVDTETMKILDS